MDWIEKLVDIGICLAVIAMILLLGLLVYVVFKAVIA